VEESRSKFMIACIRRNNFGAVYRDIQG